jgi:hypothetical protein
MPQAGHAGYLAEIARRISIGSSDPEIVRAIESAAGGRALKVATDSD